MAYSQVTEAQFITELAQALGDPTLVFFSNDELTRALHEALLCWGALTSYWTTSGTFSTVASTPFYDLSAQLPTLRTRAYTMDDLTKEMQYHLLEPQAAGVAGTGMTEQFSIGQLTSALVRRRNQFVIDASLPLTFGTFAGPTPPDNVQVLNNNVAGISRAAWQTTASAIYSPLRRTDTFAAQAFNQSWPTASGVPYAYSQAEAMPGTMLLIPPPAAAGSVHLVYSQTLALAVAGGTLMALPDEFIWAVKWGAMGELLTTHQPGYDPLRAKYCQERYSAALEVSKLTRSMLRVRVNNSPVPLVTLQELDAGKPFWQTGIGRIRECACAYDLVAFYRVPNAVYTIYAEVVQAAPLPASSSAYVNVGREELPYIYDYCRHILSWKMGGQEFVTTMPLYDNFLSGAIHRNRLLEGKVRYLTPLFGRAEESVTQVA